MARQYGRPWKHLWKPGLHKKGKHATRKLRFLSDALRRSRFPIVSGFHVSWDSRRPRGQRVLGVWLVQEPSGSASPTPFHSGTTTPAAASGANLLQVNQPNTLVDIEEVKRVKGGRQYKLVTREYMAQGHDGFEALKGHKYLVDEESGQMMSTIVRKYLLGKPIHFRAEVIIYSSSTGCRFINRMSRIQSQERIELLLNSASNEIISREKARHEQYNRHLLRKDTVSKWRHAMHLALRWSRAHYKDNIHLTEKEHMSEVDCFDGETLRRGRTRERKSEESDDTHDTSLDDLITIHPVVDGRLKDEGRP